MKKLIFTFFVFLLCIAANAQYQVIYNFSGTNGYAPYGSLISDGTYLYGMTERGGVSYNGNIVKIKPDGTGFSNLFSFNGVAGKYSEGTLLLHSDGFLYGMTTEGGTSNDGLVFKIMPNGSNYTILLNFNDTNGKWPMGSLISDSTYLYGMNSQGGVLGYGNIFKIKHDGTGFSILLNFNDTNGAHPSGDLFNDGTYLYGMTQEGGANNFGVIFKIKPDGTGFTNLHDFDSIQGKQPGAKLISDGTYLYGMTPYGGTNNVGVIFKIKPDGTGFDTLLNFTGTNGRFPFGSLISDGSYLYGTAQGGINNSGFIFKIHADGTSYTDLFDFNGTNGFSPNGDLLSDGTYLYGMTVEGGTGFNAATSNYGYGVIFKFCYTSSCSAGIDELKNQVADINIFPNPSNGVENIALNIPEQRIISVTVTNLLGQTIETVPAKQYQAGLNNITLGSVLKYPSGIYMVNIILDGQTVTKKIVFL